MTEKQNLANQQNAQKSTGPITKEGKEIVKFNAMQHGLLSNEVVIMKGEAAEDEKEFKEMRQRFIEDLKPAGVVEEMLVDRVVSSYWRLRRVIWAEQGEIRKRADNAVFEQYMQRVETEVEHSEVASLHHKERRKTSLGSEALLEIMTQAEKDIKEVGYIQEATISDIIRNYPTDRGSFGSLILTFNYTARGDEDIEEEEDEDEEEDTEQLDPEKAKKAMLGLITDERDKLKNSVEVLKEKEELTDDSYALSVSVPEPEALDKLTRYEAAIERSIYKALHELQRLQAARTGQLPPTPVAVDLDISKG